MDVTCNVIEDLLPLYADGICSEDTRTIIEHHTAMCPECREKLEAMTLKLEKNEKKVKIENPFKKVKNHYVRLVIVTLLVCAVVIVPLGGVWYLSTNTHYSNGYSWSSLKMDMKINSLCRLIKKGKYREFLEKVILPNQRTYPDNEVSELKDMLAEDFENYFKKYPIKHISVKVDEGDCDSGNAAFVIDTGDEFLVLQSLYFYYEHDNSNEIAIHYNGSEAVLDYDLSTFGTAEDNFGFGSIERQCEINYGFPGIVLMNREYASIFHNFDNDDYEVTWIAGLRADYEQRFTREGRDELREIKEKLEEMRAKYKCADVRWHDVKYMRELVSLGESLTTDRFFMQPVILTMKDSEGGKFDISFDMPIAIEGYPEYLLDLRNITYSDNTPDDFKTLFEDIFT